MPLVDPNKPTNQAFEPNVDNAPLAAKASQAGVVLTYVSFVLIIPIFIYVGSRNRLVRLQMKINEASSGIDIQLKKRKDTLEKLIDATKGSMKFEKDLLTDITKLRSQTSQNINEAVALDRNLTQVASRIMATFEAYPDIRSTGSVSKIIDAAETIEQEIAATRRLYNTYVTEFNGRLFTWPGSVVATSMQLVKLPLFAAAASDKQDVKIKFD